MSPHVRELLPLDAGGALEAGERARVAEHLRDCAACAAEAAAWRSLAGELHRLEAPRPSRALVARARGAAELLLAERAEQAWNRAALGFVAAFAWTLTVAGWLVLDLLTGEAVLRLHRSVGSTAAWYGVYLGVGWLSAGAAAVLLGRRAREEGRVA